MNDIPVCEICCFPAEQLTEHTFLEGNFQACPRCIHLDNLQITDDLEGVLFDDLNWFNKACAL